MAFLDDFITIGAACQGECRSNYEVMRRACKVLGIPLAFEKCEGPTCCLVFLGNIIDTIAMELLASRAYRATEDGAYSGSQWFQLPWTGKVVEQQIAVKNSFQVL